MKVTTIENVKGSELPQSWARRAGVKPEDVVNVTVEPAALKQGIDHSAHARLLASADASPVLDHRGADEIIGYDEHDLPK